MATILIVDDDPTIRMMFSRALASRCQTETAANGGEALRLLGAKKYDLMLLDLHMPMIDGFTVLQTLATKPGPNKDTPIYVVTADMSEQARIRALRRHAVFLLTKPVPIATLGALVDSALKKAAERAAKEHDDDRTSSVPPPAVTGAHGADRGSSVPAAPNRGAMSVPPGSNRGAAGPPPAAGSSLSKVIESLTKKLG